MPFTRVLLKLSGEALGRLEAGRGEGSARTLPAGQGIEPEALGRLAGQVVDVARLGVQLAIVVGGGNILRGAEFSAQGPDRPSADYMGMLATLINSIALSEAIERAGVDTRVLSALEVRQVAEPFVRRRALHHLERGRVVILAGGLGAPCFTTDTAAAQRAIELGCDVLLKATKVDGVYTADPRRDPNARRLPQLSYMDVLTQRLEVMDGTAVSLCMEHGLPVVVFDLFEEGNLQRVVRGENLGTKIGS